TAWAPMVGRVWSRVARAVLNPVPGSPMILSPGMRQFSKYNSVVGDPLMPSLRSLGPTVTPSSSLCTINAASTMAPVSAPVTAITVYQVDLPPLVIQHLDPLRIQSSPSATARVRIDAASLPASRSDNAYDAIASPEATAGSTCFLSSSEPRRISPIVPSLLTAGISDAEQSTRATSSITMQVATESAPCPPYSSGTWIALNPDEFNAANASSGNRAFSSTSAAYGAISFSASARIASRRAMCSSGSWNNSNDGLPLHAAILASSLLVGNFTLSGPRRAGGHAALRPWPAPCVPGRPETLSSGRAVRNPPPRESGPRADRRCGPRRSTPWRPGHRPASARSTATSPARRGGPAAPAHRSPATVSPRPPCRADVPPRRLRR